MNYKNIVDIELSGVNTKDYPDFTDAFISAASWKDTGKPLTEAQLEKLNEDSEFVYDMVFNYLF
jgi:hypothetical protein